MGRACHGRVGWAVLVLCLSLPPSARAQAADAMSAEAFGRLLAQLSDQVRGGEPGHIPALRVPAVWTVEAGGQRFEMPAGWLRRALDAARTNPSTWPAARSHLLAQLDALRSEVEALAARGTAGHPDPDAARAALTGVLSRREFRQMAQQSALARLRARALDWLRRLWDRLGGGPLGRRGTAVALAWIMTLLAAIALTSWLARTLMRPDRRRQRLPHGDPAGRTKGARAWARDAVCASDAREAARCAYRAVVSRLEEEGTWRHDDSRTPREYGRLLPADHRRRGLFADVSRRFEEIWFGARAATEDDRAAVIARLRELGCLPAD